MNADTFINAIQQLSRADKIELAKSILQPVQPDREKKLNLPVALNTAAQTPYRHPVSQLLLEADRLAGLDNLCVDDVANMAAILLYITQDHSDQNGYEGLKVAHDFTMRANLQAILNGKQVAAPEFIT